MATLDVPLYDEYPGAYELAPGRTVFVRKGVRLGQQPPYRVERSWLLPDSPGHWFWRMYGASADYDPGPTLRDLRIPLLAIWGQLDEAAPAAANVAKMEMYLRIVQSVTRRSTSSRAGITPCGSSKGRTRQSSSSSSVSFPNSSTF